jgi:hypothetical protein
MINCCFQFCFNFAFTFNLRCYNLAIVNCDVAAVEGLLRRDLIRQVILPDSNACIPLFYAALRGVWMLTATVRRLRGIEKFTTEYISELLETPNSHGRPVQVDPINLILKAPGTKCLTLKYDEPLSNFGFRFNLRRYTTGRRRCTWSSSP